MSADIDLTAPDNRSDADLVNLIRSGQTRHMEELIRRYQRMIYAIAWSYLRHESQADDVVQETFILTYSNLSGLRHPERFGPWIARIARNLSIRTARRISRERRALLVLSERRTVDQRDETTNDSVRYALDSLSPKLREAIVLYYLQEKDVRECSQFLGISETAFKTRLHRARNQMKTNLQSQDMESLKNRSGKSSVSEQVMASIPTTLLVTPKNLSMGLLSGVLPAVLPTLPTWGLVWLHHRSEMNNIRTHAETRSSIATRNGCVAMLVVMLAVIVTRMSSNEYGYELTFFALGLYMLFASGVALFNYRIQRTSFNLCIVIGSVLVGIVFCLASMGILDRQATTVVFLFYNILLFRGFKTRPYRRDYNLFQRQCMGILDNSSGDTDTAVPVSLKRLNDYTIFLGSRYLVSQVKRFKNGVRLYLPPIHVSPFSILLPIPPSWLGASILDITIDGHCQSTVSSRDFHSLTKLFPGIASQAELQSKVDAAIHASLTAFLSDDEIRAETCVQNEPDSQMFHTPPDKLKSTRWLFYISIGSGLLSLLLYLSKML